MIPWSHEIKFEVRKVETGFFMYTDRLGHHVGGGRGLYARVGEVEHDYSLGLAIKPKSNQTNLTEPKRSRIASCGQSIAYQTTILRYRHAISCCRNLIGTLLRSSNRS